MVILGLILTVLFGWSLISLLRLNMSVYGKLAAAFLIGLGLQTLLMFYLAVLHIKLDLVNITLITLIPTALLFTLSKFRRTRDQEKVSLSFTNMNPIEKLMLTGFVLLVIYVLAAGIYWPVVGWDSIALYDFRAKVFSITGFMDDAIRRGYFFGYPLMTSMAHTWVYVLGGGYPKFLYSLMYISYGIIFYELSLKWTNRTIASVFTIIAMTAAPIFSQAAYDYTNVPYDIYFFVSSAALFAWISKKENSWLVVSALAMGIATWIRSTDPFWMVNIVVLIWWSIRNKSIKYLLLYLILFLPIQQSWNLYITKMAPIVSSQKLLSQGILVLITKPDFVRMFQVLAFVVQTLFIMLLPYLLLLLTSLINAKERLRSTFYFLLIVFGNVSLLFVGAYIFSFIWEGWSLIGESLGRIGSMFIPIFVFAAAINFNLSIFRKK